MNYVLVENGTITSLNLPTIGILKDGSTVSGYNLLDPVILKNEGWLPLENNIPTYDTTKQYLQHSGYDIQTDKVISNYTVVDIVIPVPTLQDTQALKSNEINTAYNQALSAGFTSSASGTATQYLYNSEAQTAFTKLFLLRANGLLTYPTTVYSATGITIQLTDAQLTQLLQDIAIFELSLKNKQHTFLTQVQTATTVDQINAIVVIF